MHSAVPGGQMDISDKALLLTDGFTSLSYFVKPHIEQVKEDDTILKHFADPMQALEMVHSALNQPESFDKTAH